MLKNDQLTAYAHVPFLTFSWCFHGVNYPEIHIDRPTPRTRCWPIHPMRVIDKNDFFSEKCEGILENVASLLVYADFLFIRMHSKTLFELVLESILESLTFDYFRFMHMKRLINLP